jgi:hypothetical protein
MEGVMRKTMVVAIMLASSLICFSSMAYCEESSTRKAAGQIQGAAVRVQPVSDPASEVAGKSAVENKNMIESVISPKSDAGTMKVTKDSPIVSGGTIRPGATEIGGLIGEKSSLVGGATIIVGPSGTVPEGVIPGISADVRFEPGTIITYANGELSIAGAKSPDMPKPAASGPAAGYGTSSVVIAQEEPAPGGSLAGPVAAPVGIQQTGLVSVVSGKIPAAGTAATASTVDKGEAEIEAVPPAQDPAMDQARARAVSERVERQREGLKSALEGREGPKKEGSKKKGPGEGDII